MQILRLLLIILPFLAFGQVKDYVFVGSIKCSGGAEYSILVSGKEKSNISTKKVNLANFINQLSQKYLLVQTKEGKCNLDSTITVNLKRTLPAVSLLKILTDIGGFQYIFDTNLQFKPSYILLYKENIPFKDLINFLIKEIKKKNKTLKISFIPERQLLIISKGILSYSLQQQNNTFECKNPALQNYVDICNQNLCKRYIISISNNQIKLTPYFLCEKGGKKLYQYKSKCRQNSYISNLYIDNANLLEVLKIFEKLFNIRFIYEPEEIEKVKGANRVHLAVECLTLSKVLDLLKKNFHLYIQKLGQNSYRIYTDRDAYSLVLQKVSDVVTKVFYLKNISVKDFIRLLNLYFGNQVLFSADPIFNAVTVIASPKVINTIEKKLGIYIRKNNNFDNLMTKIFYIKFGSPKKIEKEIKEYLSKKGTIKYISKARAFEITDYPTNIAMIEKVFGRFLSQNPIKIKVSVKFVSINKSFARSLGINWAFVYAGTPTSIGYQNYGGYTFGGSGSKSLLSMVGESYLQGTNPTFNLAVQLAYKKVNPISLQLSALESINMAKTLDNPTLLLLNNQKATITRGIQIPYQASAENGGTTVEFATANIELTVQPVLLPDGRILLNLQLTKDEPGVFVAGQAPPINTFRINDSLIIPDGSTIVIGGVIKRSHTNSDNGIPYLKSIPLLGWLFKSVNLQKNDQELLVFITAKIINE